MSNMEDEPLPTRRTIHSEIEEILAKKLFSMVETIEETPSGEFIFKPYDDRLLIQIESFLDKKFAEKVFRRNRDEQITEFLDQLKRERDRREFDLKY